MRKLILFILCAALMLTAAGCGSASSSDNISLETTAGQEVTEGKDSKAIDAEEEESELEEAESESDQVTTSEQSTQQTTAAETSSGTNTQQTTAKQNTTQQTTAKQNTTAATTTQKTTARQTTTAAATQQTTTQVVSGYDYNYAAQVVSLVNVQRAANGLSDLTLNETAQAAAMVRAKEISASFSHTRPDGTSCFTALNEVGASYMAAGENIAYGQSTPEAVVNSWMNSSGHRANILSSSYTQIGVGCYW